jgi:hypothetical protein
LGTLHTNRDKLLYKCGHTFSFRKIVAARLHLPVNILRLDVSTGGHHNGILLLVFFQANIFQSPKNAESTVLNVPAADYQTASLFIGVTQRRGAVPFPGPFTGQHPP